MQRIAVVTGAGSGVGKATAEMLINHFEYKVIGLDLDFPQGVGIEWLLSFIEGPKEIQGGLLRHHFDVTDEIGVANFWTRIKQTMEEAEGIEFDVDLLVNSAGISLMQWSEYITGGQLRDVLEVNIVGSFLMSSCFLRKFKGEGDWENHDGKLRRIVNLGSLGSKQFFRGGTAYVVSKAGVEAMTRVMAKEHKDHGFKFFCIQPETLEGDSRIADYIKNRLYEIRSDPKVARAYGVGVINSDEEAEKYFRGTDKPQTVHDIATLIGAITTGTLDPLNGSALECLDGRS